MNISEMEREHMKLVAKRNHWRPKENFYEYLEYCGWEQEQIEKMWKIAERERE